MLRIPDVVGDAIPPVRLRARETAKMSDKTFLSHFECSETGLEYPADRFHNLSDAGAPLLARYDFANLRKVCATADPLDRRFNGLWAYRLLLPVASPWYIVSLAEVETPLTGLKLADGQSVLLKDEGLLPTGSFKARGMSVLTSIARQFGIERLAIPTAGNAGAALSAYCAQAGLGADVYCPSDANPETVNQIGMFTADLHLVDGLINDCAERIATLPPAKNWRNVATFKEPYRVEGKKTIGFEIARQCGWRCPDYVFYPTGGGVGLIGIWKAFTELRELGILKNELPKMVAVQPEGCSPIVDAWEARRDRATTCTDVRTTIHGMRVPRPFADRLMLRTLEDSAGFGIRVRDEQAHECRSRIARESGQLLCIEGAAVAAACEKALRGNLIKHDSTVVLINSASGLKDALPVAVPLDGSPA